MLVNYLIKSWQELLWYYIGYQTLYTLIKPIDFMYECIHGGQVEALLLVELLAYRQQQGGTKFNEELGNIKIHAGIIMNGLM